ncbi:hypothetical protein [Flavobacterium sp.]|jgi:hypothetical protein|uniref:hypothetical protein n=1 Tax=Flavobacterium sp. TaxID=239 RepID=UPI0037C12F2F
MTKKDFHFIKFEEGEIMMHPYEVYPLDGYEEPENFPYCCEWHKSIVDLSIEFYDKFPNCCEKHKKFAKDFNIDKSRYENIKIDIVRKMSYTMHFIEVKINNIDWYEDTLHWFEYIEKSFGHPEVGLSLYLENLATSIENSKVIPDEKKVIFNKYFEDLYKPPIKANDTDINILFTTYLSWLKLFPFELSIFKNLKEHFEKKLPFIKGKTDHNPYTGLTTAKIVNQNELIENLINNTKSILSQVDTTIMSDIKYRNQANIYNLEILNKLHKTKQETLLKEFSKPETKYIKTIKKWLENEQDYFSRVVPIINQKVLPNTTYAEKIKAFKLIGNAALIKEKATDLHNSMVLKNYVSEDCKKDFIKLFTGQTTENKISWLGQKGELKSFIDFLLSLGKIENCQSSKWQITAANFKFLNEEFNYEKMNNTKKAKNDIKIKQIVQRIN